MNGNGDAPRSKLAAVTQDTLVPAGLVILALTFGWWYRGREADREAQDARDRVAQDAAIAREIANLVTAVATAKVEIISRVDRVAEQVAAAEQKLEAMRVANMTKAEFDAYIRLANASNGPPFSLPMRQQ